MELLLNQTHWLMSENRWFYEIGRAVLISGVLVFSLWVVLKCEPFEVETDNYCQWTDLPGANAKNVDFEFKLFLRKIKKNNGLLVCGTSETGNLYYSNYWRLLLKDPAFQQQVSVMGGAGRTCGMYFPMMLNYPDEFKDLELIYFINPTYWREGYNRFIPEYYTRYVGYTQGRHVAEKELVPLDSFNRPSSIDLEDVPKSYVNALKNTFAGYLSQVASVYFPSWKTKLACSEKHSKPIPTDSSWIQNLYADLDLETNVSKKNVPKMKRFFNIDTASTYRYEELQHFITIAKDRQVNVTFVLGPYNGIQAEIFNQPSKLHHEKVVNNIREILEGSGFDYVDASDLSFVPGSFMDSQHHSKYGAYLIYKKLKAHYENKRK